MSDGGLTLGQGTSAPVVPTRGPELAPLLERLVGLMEVQIQETKNVSAKLDEQRKERVGEKLEALVKDAQKGRSLEFCEQLWFDWS